MLVILEISKNLNDTVLSKYVLRWMMLSSRGIINA